jgi:hypothetical protein
MMNKFDIKNKIFFDWMMKLKGKIKRIGTKLVKIIYHKFGLNYEIKS